jgi:hypothetical protein
MRLSRRELLRIIFKTAPAAALVATHPVLADALLPQWPKEKQHLNSHDPVLMALNGGYLIDPDFDYDALELPTVAEYEHVSEMTDEQRLALYLEWHDEEAYDLIVKALEVEELDEYSVEHLSILDPHYVEWLNGSIDVEYMGPYQSAMHSEYWIGIELLEELGSNATELGLCLVEGDHPGSSFCGVRFVGDPDVLNTQLYQRGINLRLDTGLSVSQ